MVLLRILFIAGSREAQELRTDRNRHLLYEGINVVIIVIKTVPLSYLLIYATDIRKNEMLLKKVEENTVPHSGITFLQDNFFFKVSQLD